MDERYGTLITAKLDQLGAVLPEMVEYARNLPDPIGWDTLAPGVGSNPSTPEDLRKEIRTRRPLLSTDSRATDHPSTGCGSELEVARRIGPKRAGLLGALGVFCTDWIYLGGVWGCVR